MLGMSALKRFWRWLRHPEYQEVGIPYMEVVKLREESFHLGRAVGELEGRQALAAELARQFFPDCAKPMTAEDAVNIKLRQVH